MDFRELVIKYLFPILKEYGFKVLNESHDIIRFQSPVIDIIISFNAKEQSYLVQLGTENDEFYPLSDIAIKNIFGLEVHIEQVGRNEFIENILYLLQLPEGIRLLKGDLKLLKKITLRFSKEYTSELINSQLLEKTLIIWKKGDYKSFVNVIDKIGLDRVSQLFQLRYKIAKSKSERE